MRERTRRRRDKEGVIESVVQWPPKPWVAATAAAILAVLLMVYVF